MLPSREELRELSHRAVVAYVTCAARMVQPFMGAGRYLSSREHIKAVDDAIRIAEQFAEKRIKATGDDKIVSARAAVAAATTAADDHFADAAARVATYVAARAANVFAADEVRLSLRTIYELLKTNDATKDDPIDFQELNIWINGIPPQWFITVVRRNTQLQEYWKEKNLNPWNMLEIAQGTSEETKYVPLPDLEGTIRYTASFANRSSIETIPEPEPLPDTITPPGTKSELLSNTNHDNAPCLGINDIAAALGDVLIDSKEPLCVGILGQWGSGKSRLMHEVKKYLGESETQERERFVTVDYNAWKYRCKPENWAYLYEYFAAKLRESSWFAMIRAGVIRHGLWPIILALFLISLPWLMTLEPFSKRIVSLFGEHISWGTLIIGIIGYGGGSGILVSFLRDLYQSAASVQKRYLTLPSHQDKLGLQAAIGNDFCALIRGWTTIKPNDHHFNDQTLVAMIVKTILNVALFILYGILGVTALLSLGFLLSQLDLSGGLLYLFCLPASIVLLVALLPGLLFFHLLIRSGIYWCNDEKNQDEKTLILCKKALVWCKNVFKKTYTKIKDL